MMVVRFRIFRLLYFCRPYFSFVRFFFFILYYNSNLCYLFTKRYINISALANTFALHGCWNGGHCLVMVYKQSAPNLYLHTYSFCCCCCCCCSSVLVYVHTFSVFFLVSVCGKRESTMLLVLLFGKWPSSLLLGLWLSYRACGK